MAGLPRSAAIASAVALLCGCPAVVAAASPGLKLSGAKPPARVSAGSAMSLRVTVRNSGRARSKAVKLRWYLSRDARLGRGDKALRGTRRVAALAPGRRSSGVTSVRVPATVRPASYRLLVCAARRCAVLGKVKVGPPRPDLVVAAVGAAPGRVAPGDRLTVVVDVRNAGGARAGASRVALQLRRGAAVTALAPGRAVAALGRSGSSAAATSGTLPAGLPAGTYGLQACADADGKVREGSEANNCKGAAGAVEVSSAGGGGGPGPGPGPGGPGPGAPPVGAPLEPPANSTSTATDFGDSTAFLYAGAGAPQQGVAAGAIDRRRVAVLRGRVVDRSGAPVGGVRVALLGRPELGHVLTRADGGYDLAVNGGGLVTLSLTRVGYLPVQRQQDVPWQDFVTLPDVALTPVDAASSVVASGSAAWQVHRSSMASDGDGARRTTLLFPPGLQASMTMEDGSHQPLPAMTIRATEFTTGEGGPAAMPGDLPAQSGYTFATEYSVDEALAAGATGVEFDRPVIAYTSNFVGFPVGQRVPAGTYDGARGLWSAENDGRVVKLLDAGGAIDADGDGQPDSPAQLAALGISDGERAQLAAPVRPRNRAVAGAGDALLLQGLQLGRPASRATPSRRTGARRTTTPRRRAARARARSSTARARCSGSTCRSPALRTSSSTTPSACPGASPRAACGSGSPAPRCRRA